MIMYMKRSVVLLCFAFVSVVVGAEQYMFSHLSMMNKLSHTQVNDVFKSTDGYVWFSTAWGLNRYDGYSMQTFLNVMGDSTSIPNNYIDWVRDIPGDRLFIKNNLTKYCFFDKRTETFSDASTFFKNIGLRGYAESAFIDESKRLWLWYDGECYLYSFADSSLTHVELYRSKTKDKGTLIDVVSTEKEVLLVFDDGAMYRLTSKAAKPMGSVERLKSPLQGGTHIAIIDSDDDYWVITHGSRGVWYYERKADKWHFCTSDKNSYFVVDNMVASSICEDDKNCIWVAGDHDGISVIDKHTRNVVSLKSDKHDERSLISDGVSCVYADSNNVMWVGYCTEGVSFYNESIYKISVDRLDFGIGGSNFKADVNCIEEDRNGNLWYGMNGNGLLFKNVRTGQTCLYRHDANDPNSLSGDVVVCMHLSSDGSMWIGTYMGGLCRYDGKRFVSYKGRTDLPKAMTAESVWSITEDADKNLWIGSLGEGVVCYNVKSGEYKEYNEAKGLLSSDFVSKILVCRNGLVYVGTSDGLTIINTSDNTSLVMSDRESSGYTIGNVNDIYEDSRGMLWICTRGGLVVYDKKINLIMKLGKDEGVDSDVINAIVEDNDRNMWLSTTNGITNIVVSLNPRAGKYSFSTYNYDTPDGVLGCVLNMRAIKRTSYGQILIGGSNGVNSFVPSDISYNKILPNVKFVGLSIFDEEISVGEKIGDRVLLQEALIYTDEVQLDYSYNMFSVDFTTMSNILPEKILYSYMLEGFNDKWLTTNQPSVTYTNLAPGRYTLKVKAANCDGFEGEEASQLHIVVLPPWWRSSWAYFIYGVILIFITLFVRKQILRREREKYRVRQIEADAQKQREVDDMKLRFFTNVSHELRTPLSLIVTPLEQLLDNHLEPELRSKVEMMHRNAIKLLQMVNQLLDFRKNDLHGMQVNYSEGDIVSFVKHACESFRSLSDRMTTLTFTAAVPELNVEFDKDKMTKIIDNLLSNAYKYTPEEGRIDIKVGKSTDNQNVVIRVADSGCGISDEHKKHIFERFYQVPQFDSTHGGSGIGLHMVHEFVKMHDGTIEVRDNVGQGTVFVITFPIRYTPKMHDADSVDDMGVMRQTILIVDDNADFRMLLHDTFKATYDTMVAGNGEEALVKMQSCLPDVVITDVMMPAMDGIELCERIKNDVRFSHIPVIMLTAKTADEHKIEGLIAGADDYIAKPFNPHILMLKVSNLMELSRKRHDTFKYQIEPEPSQITITPLDEVLIEKAIKYVEDNMTSADLSVEDLSRSLGMSRVHLYKKLTAITGRSPIEFIRVIRLKRAAQMLSDKRQNIADVAYAVGFNNPKYFSKYFKEEFGVLPSVYQNNKGDAPTSIDISAEMDDL